MSDIEKLAHFIDASQNIVFFTGAGISTESGIPDFRSPGGLWEKNRPIDFSEFIASEDARREAWRRKFNMERVMKGAEPNIGHKVIGELYSAGKVNAVVTQNIDGLHQLGGVADEDVIEIHGNGTYAKCLECHKKMSLDAVKKIFAVNETLPTCSQCGGIVKTATISFGQAMPEEEMRRAEMEAIESDLFIVAGSSLVVFPAANIPVIAAQHGAKLVIINREETPLDPYAELTINSEIGETLSGVTKM
ncbi:NAD-dependent deacetylase [Sneathiella sp. P13V-1]|uniref:SIR2 family NAD-dependent protein deacylase n=1 Tax=Sneathiella sp. P13V-1 TaxID=2697366 RepID=UPI00187B1D94|nr:Sir2 family NAD-dependent protein deacetylase [Sneathiella sp. P13V-1]MBE7637212.1 NAD-dependent deacetylase [Sneathiella sp. P13V-1]